MKKKDFLLLDYHRLNRIQDESKLKNAINQSDIGGQILPLINALKNEVFNLIDRKEYRKIDLDSTTLLIDTQLKDILDSEVTDNTVKSASNLFSVAFKKLQSRIFDKDGDNSSNIPFESEIEEWLEELLALEISKDEKFKPYPIIRSLMRRFELLHNFYTVFKDNIPVGWIDDNESDWIEVSHSAKDVLDFIRTFDDDYFKGYAQEIQSYEGKSLLEYTKLATRFSDHAMFSDEYSFRNGFLLQKNISLWISFWDNLKYPILQNIPFVYINDTETYTNLAEQLVSKRGILNSNPKLLACMLLINLFETSLKTAQRLSIYKDENNANYITGYDKNAALLSEGKLVSEEWGNLRQSIYSNVIMAISSILSVEEIDEWVFSYNKRANDNGYSKLYNEEIDVLITVYHDFRLKKNASLIIESEKFSLPKFVYTVSHIAENENEVELEKILKKIVEYIQSKEFYWDRSFSQNYWHSLKAFGKLLSSFNRPLDKAHEILNRFEVFHEGWGITSISMDKVERETFVYCGILFLFEHLDKINDPLAAEAFFKLILDRLISQVRFSRSVIDEYYFQPLFLMKLIANQIMSEQKDMFDECVICNFDNVIDVLNIYREENDVLSQTSKSYLVNRIDLEYKYEKMKMMQREQKRDIVKWDEIVNRLS